MPYEDVLAVGTTFDAYEFVWEMHLVAKPGHGFKEERKGDLAGLPYGPNPQPEYITVFFDNEDEARVVADHVAKHFRR